MQSNVISFFFSLSSTGRIHLNRWHYENPSIDKIAQPKKTHIEYHLYFRCIWNQDVKMTNLLGKFKAKNTCKYDFLYVDYCCWCSSFVRWFFNCITVMLCWCARDNSHLDYRNKLKNKIRRDRNTHKKKNKNKINVYSWMAWAEYFLLFFFFLAFGRTDNNSKLPN